MVWLDGLEISQFTYFQQVGGIDCKPATGEITAAWNPGLPAGGTVSFGFNGTHTGANPAPSTFTLNGTACTAG